MLRDTDRQTDRQSWILMGFFKIDNVLSRRTDIITLLHIFFISAQIYILIFNWGKIFLKYTK